MSNSSELNCATISNLFQKVNDGNNSSLLLRADASRRVFPKSQSKCCHESSSSSSLCVPTMANFSLVHIADEGIQRVVFPPFSVVIFINICYKDTPCFASYIHDQIRVSCTAKIGDRVEYDATAVPRCIDRSQKLFTLICSPESVFVFDDADNIRDVEILVVRGHARIDRFLTLGKYYVSFSPNMVKLTN